MAPALLLTFLAAGCASGPTEPDAFPDAFLASSYDTPAGLSLLEPSVPNAEWWGWRSSGVVEDNPGRLNLSAWPNTRLGAGTVQQGHVAYYVSASHRDAALGSFALRFPDAAQASAWLDAFGCPDREKARVEVLQAGRDVALLLPNARTPELDAAASAFAHEIRVATLARDVCP